MRRRRTRGFRGLAACCAALCLIAACLPAEPDDQIEEFRTRMRALHERWDALGGVSFEARKVDYACQVSHTPASGVNQWEVRKAGHLLVYASRDLHYEGRMDGAVVRTEKGEIDMRIWTGGKGRPPNPASKRRTYRYYEGDDRNIHTYTSFDCARWAFGFVLGDRIGDIPAAAFRQATPCDSAGTVWCVQLAPTHKPSPGLLSWLQVLRFSPDTGLLEHWSVIGRDGSPAIEVSIAGQWHEHVREFLPVVTSVEFFNDDPRPVGIRTFNNWSVGLDAPPEVFGWTALGVDPMQEKGVAVEFTAKRGARSVPYFLEGGRFYRRAVSWEETYKELAVTAASDPSVLFTSSWAMALLAVVLTGLIIVIRASTYVNRTEQQQPPEAKALKRP